MPLPNDPVTAHLQDDGVLLRESGTEAIIFLSYEDIDTGRIHEILMQAMSDAIERGLYVAQADR